MTKKTIFAACLCFILVLFACSNSNDDGNECKPHQTYDQSLYECKPEINPNGIYLKQKPKDAEGNEYEAVLIGTQVWMAENLNLAKDRNGNSIGRCFEDNPANCDKYGRMYILTEHGTDPDLGGGEIECPDGWRLPSSEDLGKLLKYIDPSYKEGSEMTGRGDNSAGTKLKARSGWPPDYKGDDGNGTDDYGFNALPGGYCGTGCGIYEKTNEPTWSMLYPPVAGSAATPSKQANSSSFWWTTSKGQPVPLAITWRISSGTVVDDAFQSYNNSRFYARCLKDVGNQITSSSFSFDNIQYWVGEGESRAMLIVQWNDGKSPRALAWGYRWPAAETKHGIDIINDIAKTDGRLFFLTDCANGSGFGCAIGGIGFDASGNNEIQLISNGGACESPVNGIVEAASGYDYDDWKLCDGAHGVRWGAGWYEAYWSYWVSDAIDGKWGYSGLGASSRVLKNNSIDAWYFDLDMNDPELSTFYRCMADPDNCDGKDFFGNIAPVSEVEP